MKLITMVTVLIGGGIPGVGVRPEGSPLRVWLKLHLSSVLESPHQFHHLWGSPYSLTSLGSQCSLSVSKVPKSSHLLGGCLHPLISLCVSGPFLKSFSVRTGFDLDS